MRQMYGYGDMVPGRVANALEAFKQRHYHIVISPPGSNPVDPSWGLGIHTYIGKNIYDTKHIEQIAKAAHMKDSETAEAHVTITKVSESVYKYRVDLKTKNGATATVEETFNGA